MNPINPINQSIFYQPDKGCHDWCVQSFKENYNNLDLTACFIVAAVLVLLLLYEWFNEHESLKPHAPKIIIYAKLLLYIFFFYYFLVIRWGVYLHVG